MIALPLNLKHVRYFTEADSGMSFVARLLAVTPGAVSLDRERADRARQFPIGQAPSGLYGRRVHEIP